MYYVLYVWSAIKFAEVAVTCLEIKYPGQINTPEWGQKEGRGEETRSGA